MEGERIETVIATGIGIAVVVAGTVGLVGAAELPAHRGAVQGTVVASRPGPEEIS